MGDSLFIKTFICYVIKTKCSCEYGSPGFNIHYIRNFSNNTLVCILILVEMKCLRYFLVIGLVVVVVYPLLSALWGGVRSSRHRSTGIDTVCAESGRYYTPRNASIMDAAMSTIQRMCMASLHQKNGKRSPSLAILFSFHFPCGRIDVIRIHRFSSYTINNLLYIIYIYIIINMANLSWGEVLAKAILLPTKRCLQYNRVCMCVFDSE